MRILALIASLLVSNCSAAIWSMAQWGDIHAPENTLASIGTNFAAWITANTNDGVFNIKVLISPGDLYEMETNGHGSAIAGGFTNDQMTNSLRTIANSGIKVIACKGNHDCDSPDPAVLITTFWWWNTNFPVSFFSNQVGYIGTKDPGDSSNLIFSYTNGAIKLLFLTYSAWPEYQTVTNFWDWYSPQTAWIKSNATLYPDHNVIVMGHQFLDGRSGVPSYADGPSHGVPAYHGPGLAPYTNSISSLTNLLYMISGHDRYARRTRYTMQAADGHLIDTLQFNTQGYGNTTNSGVSAYVNLYTFNETAGTVTVRVYDWVASRFVTNNAPDLFNNDGGSAAYDWTNSLAVPRTLKAFRLQ